MEVSNYLQAPTALILEHVREEGLWQPQLIRKR